MGACFTSIFSVFSIMAGWIVEMVFMLFFAYIAVYCCATDKTYVAEQDAYRLLMGFLIINL